MRISYWSSDVCSSDLGDVRAFLSRNPIRARALDSDYRFRRLHAEPALGAPEAPEGSPVDRWRQLCALLLCLPLCSHLPLGGSRGRRLSAAGGERAVSALLPARRAQPEIGRAPV